MKKLFVGLLLLISGYLCAQVVPRIGVYCLSNHEDFLVYEFQDNFRHKGYLVAVTKVYRERTQIPIILDTYDLQTTAEVK